MNYLKMVPIVSAAPMGWSAKCTDENKVEQAANIMEQKGLRDIGYEYIVLDDCWMEN